MIQPQELKIGNYLKCLGEIMKVCDIREDSFRVKDKEGIEYKNKWTNIEPIPLTEEILLKFGAVKYDGLSRHFFLYQNRIYDIYKDGGIWHLFINVKGREVKFNQSETLYVHQLQNLFYSLTGKELTFKEE